MMELMIVLVLILISGFLSLAEMAVMTSRRSRLKQLAQTSLRARRALALSEKPENFLSTTQIGITLTGILIGVFGGSAIGLAIAPWIERAAPSLASYAESIGLGVSVALITFLTLIFGELVPKRLAITRSEDIAGYVALPVGWLARVAAPAVTLLAATTRLVLRLLRAGKDQRMTISEEEIRLLVSESHEHGVIDDDERNMMNRVLRLGDRSAESLMTPRTRIVWLDANESFAENLEAMRATPFSRYPVLRGSDDDVVGVLEVKSLLDRIDETEFDLFKYLRETLFVSESTPALKLLEIFRQEQQSLALVVDEYGDVTGLITINDLLEAVIGRTRSGEGNDATPLVVVREDGSLLVDGSLTTDNVRELLGGGPLPDEDEHDYHTAAGMVIAHFSRIPNTGEAFEWNGWRIEVVDLDGPRIDKLLLQRLPEPTSDHAQ